MVERDRIAAIAEKTASWPFRMFVFGEAIALDGLLAAADRLDEPRYEQHAAALCLAAIGRGLGSSPDDHVGPGRALLALYRRRGDPRFLEAARALVRLHERIARNPEGALLVRGHQSGWAHQIWIDSVDLIGPLFARFAAASGEDERYEQAIALTLAHLKCLQAENGLVSHGYDTHAGRNGQFWARGSGWGLMGMADVLAHAPRATPGWPELEQRLMALLSALLPLQLPDGLWPTVVDRPESYAETTLAAMLAIAVRQADTAGIAISNDAKRAADKASEAVRRHVDADGGLGLVSEATPVGQYSTYATRPFGIFPWGQGPLLLMECEA